MTEMVRVTKRRYEVGEIPQNESLRVELAAAEAEADQRKAEAAYQAASRAHLICYAVFRSPTEQNPVSSRGLV